MLKWGLKSQKLSTEETTLSPYCIGLQENLIHIIPTYRLSHWIQMKFYSNPPGPAKISLLK
jgi:hypothetical protein